MPAPDRDLNALLGSRICHDLISPLGAIGNGVELMQLAGNGDGPEMALISQSVDNANLRIRYFRIAFGAAGPAQTVSGGEIAALLAPDADGRRLEIDWQPQGDQPRRAVKLAFLILQCFESAMPFGGTVRISRDGDESHDESGGWQIAGSTGRLKIDADLWALLSNPATPVDLAPAQVHFALIAPELKRQGRRAAVAISDDDIRVEF